jgi:MinD-like ATPase involved in chromosome partitioning or flagellar assembly
MADGITAEAEQEGCAVTGRIPFDPSFVEAMVAKKTVLEYNPKSPASKAVKKIWDEVYRRI